MNTKRARELRKNLTDAERRLWRILKHHQVAGVKFRRQQPLGSFIVDFVCFERRLIVEVDGGQHSEQISYDEQRTAWLEAQGYCVLRFWNNDVLANAEGVALVIGNAVEERSPPPHLDPPPQGGEEVLQLSPSIIDAVPAQHHASRHAFNSREDPGRDRCSEAIPHRADLARSPFPPCGGRPGWGAFNSKLPQACRNF